MQESQIRRNYSIMINQKLQGFKEEVKPIGETLTQATLELYYAVTARFLPTPAKIHYLRDTVPHTITHGNGLDGYNYTHTIQYLKNMFTKMEIRLVTVILKIRAQSNPEVILS